MQYILSNALIGTDGTSFQLEIDISYRTIIRLFGRPNGETDGYKVDAEWVVGTPDGVATIYNYKTGKSYLGVKGIAITKIREWHIGAKSTKAAAWVYTALEAARRLEK